MRKKEGLGVWPERPKQAESWAHAWQLSLWKGNGAGFFGGKLAKSRRPNFSSSLISRATFGRPCDWSDPSGRPANLDT